MGVKSELRKYLENGQAFSHGSADRLLDVQSAGRRLRELAQEMDLYYFWTKGRRGSGYKVFARKKNAFKVFKDPDTGLWFIQSMLRNEDYLIPVYSPPFKTKGQALKAIKRTNA